jgi:DNA-binding transcriptional ArsR family regulator
VDQDLSNEIKELNKRISDLEKMLSVMMEPLRTASATTRNYMRLIGLVLDHGGLTPDVILPEVKDPISKEIVRVLLDRSDQNISQVTQLVRSRRGTASRRIVREKLRELEKHDIIRKQQQGSRFVYSLTDKVIKKWSQMLGFPI